MKKYVLVGVALAGCGGGGGGSAGTATITETADSVEDEVKTSVWGAGNQA